MKRKLLQNIASLSSVQMANYLLPLVLVPYLVRTLGPAQYGSLNFSTATVQYFVLLTDYGFALTATQDVARNTHDVSRIFWRVTASKILLGSAGFLMLMALVAMVPAFSRNATVLLISYLAVIGNVIFPVWLFQGLQRMKPIMVCNIASRLLVLPLVFILVRSGSDVWIAAALQSGSTILSGIFSLIFLASLGVIRWEAPTYGGIRSTLIEGWYVFVGTASVSLYTTSSVIILGLVSGDYAVGQYAAADKIRLAVQNLIGPISQSVFPYTNALMDESPRRAFQFTKKLLNMQAAGTLAMSLTLFGFAGPIVRLLLGTHYPEATPIVRILAFVPFEVGLSNVFGIQTMLPMGLKRTFRNVLLAAGFLNLPIVVATSYVWRGEGTAIGVLFIEGFVTLTMMAILLRRQVPIFFWMKVPAA